MFCIIETFQPLIIQASCEDVAVIFQLNVRFSVTLNFTELANSVTDGGNVAIATVLVEYLEVM